MFVNARDSACPFFSWFEKFCRLQITKKFSMKLQDSSEQLDFNDPMLNKIKDADPNIYKSVRLI